MSTSLPLLETKTQVYVRARYGNPDTVPRQESGIDPSTPSIWSPANEYFLARCREEEERRAVARGEVRSETQAPPKAYRTAACPAPAGDYFPRA